MQHCDFSLMVSNQQRHITEAIQIMLRVERFYMKYILRCSQCPSSSSCHAFVAQLPRKQVMQRVIFKTREIHSNPFETFYSEKT